MSCAGKLMYRTEGYERARSDFHEFIICRCNFPVYAGTNENILIFYGHIDVFGYAAVLIYLRLF